MHHELTLSVTTVYAFLLVLARVAGVFAFIPLPGIKAGPEVPRIILSVTLTMALLPRWPVLAEEPGLGALLAWLVLEAVLGVATGLCVAMLLDALVFGAQVMGLQAGYAYASTIDPNSQADSGVLLVIVQLVAGMLFFAMGLHRDVIQVVALSLETNPPGNFALGSRALEHVISFGAAMLATGLRLAMPIVALLVLVDVCLALLGRINSQLQLLTLAFPLKMLGTLVILGWVAVLIPALFRQASGRMLATLQAILTR
jgi:flagellar biosynthetic protein FliR